jgi:hypothetical protein
MVDGVTFVLVDAPPVIAANGTDQPTLADQIEQGARPYCVHVLADQLISWSSESIGGVQQLTEARIKECTHEKDGEWGQIEVERIRVLRPGYFAIYRKVKEGEQAGQYLLEEEGLTSLKFIPLVAIYSNRTGFFEGEPPLQSLADLNLEHWISSSENRAALTFLRFAMLVITGATEQSTVEIGASKVIQLPAGGTAQYVEHTGAGINAGFKDLEQIEIRMDTTSMLVRVQNVGRVTATAAAINSDNSNAGLLAIADGLEDAFELVLDYMNQMLGGRPGTGGSLAVNDDFGESATLGTATELLAALTVGAISLETYLGEMKRRMILDESLDIQEEIDRIQNSQLGNVSNGQGGVSNGLE